ncbi:Methylmalonic aciduria and homocystinuria type D [Paragonimus heterotremus]|uniref:Methylmalonic aciduria and homocystinuria type D n=1 Tax=Paragonimus heterotremus TaxID=100268 RepID=A0A8J4SN39_9TREM|nr:Methylmalonic aciduria and homocystinuria type D [Paragonimus heterotremus]
MKALQSKRSIFANFHRLVKHFRISVNAFSAFQRDKPSTYVIFDTNAHKRQWPNQTLGPIDTINPKYPLPGFVGFLPSKSEVALRRTNLVPATHTLPLTREDNYASVLIETYNATELENTNCSLIPPKSDLLECAIYTCPTLIKQDLVSIFPSRKFEAAPLTAVVLSHRTTEGLSEWSELAASEREALAETFTKSAIDICASLKELGYWADFINPYTGTPYLGAHGEASLSETDDKMRHFGFEIDDVRCCKVLRHPRWKHNVFAGLIFTDAPKDHPVLAHF